jgi:hypothetical protein
MIDRGDELKFDRGKPMWDLIPLEQIEKIVEVLTFGANKYAKDKWKEVPDAKERYFASLMRHLTKWRFNEDKDSESGLSHLAHAACCLIFLMWFEDNNNKTL